MINVLRGIRQAVTLELPKSSVKVKLLGGNLKIDDERETVSRGLCVLKLRALPSVITAVDRQAYCTVYHRNTSC